MSARQGTRMHMLLAVLARLGEVTVLDLRGAVDWTVEVVDKTLSNAVVQGLVADTGRKVERYKVYAITPRGTERIGALSQSAASTEAAQATPGAANGQAEPATAEMLIDRALALIDDTPAGMDTEALSAELGLMPRDTDAMLARHVTSGRLVACALQRAVNGELRSMMLYRTSVSGLETRNDWRLGEFVSHAQRLLTPPQPKLVLPVVEVDIDAVHRKAPSPVRLQAAETSEARETTETPAEVIAAELAQQQPRATRADEGDGAAAELDSVDPGEGFLAALYSDGVLWMQFEDGRQVDLQPDETRALFRFLDRMAGTALEAALP